jgi:hypothetical protein
MLIGDLEVGRLTETHTIEGVTHCSFEPLPAFARYARAFSSGDIWESEDDTLDAVIDEIAVDGVFLVGDDGSETIDPDLRIDGKDAWFSDQSSSST